MTSKLRIAVVVQRYGVDVNGGAERLCRVISERLARYHDIEVLTSRALDYLTWRDHYPVGLSTINGVTIRRFSVKRERNINKFNDLSKWLLSTPHTIDDELHWIRLQGPDCPDLLSHLEANARNYDLFVFFTYLYLPTCLGLPLVANRSLLVPMAHNEPWIYFGIYDQLFQSARSVLFNTPEEMDFVRRRFCSLTHEGALVGIGIDAPAPPSSDELWTQLRRRLGDSHLITYVGRIDESKGCRNLFDYFQRYVRERPAVNMTLLLLGKSVMPVPSHPQIISPGFVPEQAKRMAIDASRVVVVPSRYESLSIVLLEAWSLGKPVLVNGDCDVLRGQCRRSNGGLSYTDYDDFRECLDLLISDPALCSVLGAQGQAFVRQTYQWELVDRQYEYALRAVVAL